MEKLGHSPEKGRLHPDEPLALLSALRDQAWLIATIAGVLGEEDLVVDLAASIERTRRSKQEVLARLVGIAAAERDAIMRLAERVDVDNVELEAAPVPTSSRPSDVRALLAAAVAANQQVLRAIGAAAEAGGSDPAAAPHPLVVRASG